MYIANNKCCNTSNGIIPIQFINSKPEMNMSFKWIKYSSQNDKINFEANVNLYLVIYHENFDFAVSIKLLETKQQGTLDVILTYNNAVNNIKYTYDNEEYSINFLYNPQIPFFLSTHYIFSDRWGIHNEHCYNISVNSVEKYKHFDKYVLFKQPLSYVNFIMIVNSILKSYINNGSLQDHIFTSLLQLFPKQNGGSSPYKNKYLKYKNKYLQYKYKN